MSHITCAVVSEWISVDKDETGGPKGKSTMVSRVGHEYVKSVYLSFRYACFYTVQGVYVIVVVYPMICPAPVNTILVFCFIF